eukprot:TRINITY_DN18256_c0_g1_i1.p1 TRINITY_DN18256_c0_g1~~TRINITY_DN18256_c0_g1_i1.p1  ORF type:complete len:182 (-),score=46.91 TRINITY_DN18256_c0_g1_i1:30-575(-)
MMSAEMEELTDLIEALKNCNDSMKQNSADFNSSIGMPVFVLIEEKLSKKITSIESKKSKLTSKNAEQFKELKQSVHDTVAGIKSSWSSEFKIAYEKSSKAQTTDSTMKELNAKGLSAGVDSLKKLALMLSRDMRGGGPGLDRGPAPSSGKDLAAIDKEQKEYENYQMKFDQKDNESCCLLL